jgi:hypothetical protein
LSLLEAEYQPQIESSYEYEYQYQTESYDFNPYQSVEDHDKRSEARGFTYNKSIGDEQSSMCSLLDKDDHESYNFDSILLPSEES